MRCELRLAREVEHLCSRSLVLGLRDRLLPATATSTGAQPSGVALPEPAHNVNGNEEPPDAKRHQVPNKGLQLTRALGAGAYSLVGWAAWDALVKVGPSQLKPSVGCTVEVSCVGGGDERKTHSEQLQPPTPSLASWKSASRPSWNGDSGLPAPS